MTNLEMLRTGTPKQIADMLCKCLKNCSACPHSFRECCNNGEKNGFEEWLNEETKAPKNSQKEWIKSRNEFCSEIGDCDMCPPSISWHCKEAFKAMEAWKKPQEPKDAPRGWIKLKTTQGDICINASTIVDLVDTSPDASVVMNGAVTEVYTEVYIRGNEDEPWFAYDTINEIIEKIKKA